MSTDYRIAFDWMGGIIGRVDGNKKELHPVLQEFHHLIETNPRVYMLIGSMLQQVPKRPPYDKDPTGSPQIRDHHRLLQALNVLMTTAPSWNDQSDRVGLVGLPINTIFDWPMGTPSGFAAFLDPDINAMLKKIINTWAEFLRSPASAEVLNESASGWFGETGMKSVTGAANIGPAVNSTFDEMFVCDPSAPHRGYKSWDDFFTRRFRDGIRPVASPDDPKVIANSCESEPYRTARNIKATDVFWLKSQPYSVYHMLAHDELASHFVGGTVYQAFLSVLSYHRWHSPVSGKVVKTFVVDGTYYSEPLFEGVGDPYSQNKDIDVSGEVTSQSYLTATATKAVIFIQANSPAIGLVAFIAIGMWEVSTCDITVKEGDHLSKGDQMGMFHYGGSSHCLLFRRGVNVSGFPPSDLNQNVPVMSKLAEVS